MAAGSELRTKRISAGIAGALVCLKTGISRSRLSDIERDYVTSRNDEVARISAALDDLIRAKRKIEAIATEEGCPSSLSVKQLTDVLAERVMGWLVGPDRFMMDGRRWFPRLRFQPLERVEDAFRLLEQTAPQEYTLGNAENGSFWAKVRVAGVAGEACEPSQARAITFAIARALGIDPETNR